MIDDALASVALYRYAAKGAKRELGKNHARFTESPHEHQQNLLLSRIITNVEKLNEAIVVMNKSLQEINIQNMNIELVAQMFKNYQSNVLFHLEATDNLKEPV
ncbi:DASH complex subunit Dad4-domain-containing protein [Annulohypoxylon nitens]|nr:DASH complex subunit Dad4-domain-containing protein [Annulohypoxylon nitens]